jgi:hypothetical protein
MRRVNINQPEFNLTQKAGYSWRARAGPGDRRGADGGDPVRAAAWRGQLPYHYEYGCEEWLLLVSGSATLRDPMGITPDGR